MCPTGVGIRQVLSKPKGALQQKDLKIIVLYTALFHT
jgi:hypothetical protein